MCYLKNKYFAIASINMYIDLSTRSLVLVANSSFVTQAFYRLVVNEHNT